jgi:hypothetical protein
VTRYFLSLILLCAVNMFGLTTAEIKAHKATYKISQYTLLVAGQCTATAIGPHAVLTASHCEEATESIYIGDQQARVVKIMRDNADHTILFLKGIEFKEFVPIRENSSQIGDDVFVFGNPGTFEDIYRRGYLSGQYLETYGTLKVPIMLFDFHSFPGDSGAAIFNRDGEIVAVVSVIRWIKSDPITFTLVGSYPLLFSDQDLKMAKEF